MGLLDDAIREHLDLKRRRGADPAEVERDEREALGPVRRRDPGDAAPPADDSPVGDGLAYDQDAESHWGREAPADAVAEPRSVDDLPPLDEPVVDEAPARPAAEPTAQDWSAAEDEAFDADPFPDAEPASREPAAGEPAGRAPELSGDETREFSVEDAIDPADVSAEDGEDMLEETPEFLQDTPDHDRLWFEQRPPRDFDFDG